MPLLATTPNMILHSLVFFLLFCRSQELLYKNPMPYTPREFGSGTVGWSIDVSDRSLLPPPAEEKQSVRVMVSMEGNDASNLLRMTPYWWKARPEQQALIDVLPSLSTTLEVLLSRHRYSC